MSGYKALYRKWRPSVFSDVIGQEHITSVLKSEVMSGSVSHAYLFCGSRGTGKTTCAKILAKAVSCENPQNGDPCGKCASCIASENTLDIYEIDAASHNGVDNIRELRDTVVYPPSEMKRRVYIIDEVHMLSDGAFNALLKTLEEPPEHVLFILATTELRKIPATILSRCKRFDFHRITPEKICERLKTVSAEENIKITDSALMLIARLAAGAMRDALSMLELFYMSDHEVSEEEASERLGVVGRSVVFALLDAVCEGNSGKALSVIADAYDNSKDLGVLCSELSDTLRDVLVTKYVKDAGKLIDATEADISRMRGFAEKLSDEKLMYCQELCEDIQNRLARAVFSRRTVIETGIIKMCEERLCTDSSTLLARISALEEKISELSLSPSRLSGAAAVYKHEDALVLPKANEAENAEEKALYSGSESGEEDVIHSESGFGSASESAEIPDLPPPPIDDDIPFDGPYNDVADNKKKVSPRPLAPRPLVPRSPASPNPDAAASGTPGNRKPMSGYAEFIEGVEAADKMAASMLEGGAAYIGDNSLCELELINPIAPMILSKPDKTACLTAVLSELLGYAPQIRIKFVKRSEEKTLTDLSQLK